MTLLPTLSTTGARSLEEIREEEIGMLRCFRGKEPREQFIKVETLRASGSSQPMGGISLLEKLILRPDMASKQRRMNLRLIRPSSVFWIRIIVSSAPRHSNPWCVLNAVF